MPKYVKDPIEFIRNFDFAGERNLNIQVYSVRDEGNTARLIDPRNKTSIALAGTYALAAEAVADYLAERKTWLGIYPLSLLTVFGGEDKDVHNYLDIVVENHANCQELLASLQTLVDRTVNILALSENEII